jgi:hypothetical protein
MMSPKGKTRKDSDGQRWYLLIHQLPPEPLYLRAKIRQRLARVGAVAVKNAVYALPLRDECLEDFQWIAQEAISGGGEAFVCEAEFLEKRVEKELVERSRADRDEEYAALAEAIEEWKAEGGAELPARASRARRRFDEIERIDFFRAPGRAEVARRVAELEALRSPKEPGAGGEPLVGRTWVTRKGLHIDRIASAWLIRRFLDSRARFRFIDPKEPLRKGEIRFDIVEGDFSHEGDRCTFETLVARTGLTDRALMEIGEIVHDIDLKDEKFARAEAAGVERLVNGIVIANPLDEERLTRGAAFFDELYQAFRGKTTILQKEAKR